MGAHSIVIGSTTLSGPLLQYDIARSAKITDKGEVESTDYTIRIRGAEVESTAGANVDDTLTISDLVKGSAANVEIKLDGTAKLTLATSSAFVGPFVTDFSTEFDEGAGESHWRYNLTIFARMKEKNQYDLQTSLEVQKNATGKVVRKIWRASAKAKTADAAVSAVLTFKPGGDGISETITRYFNEARAEAEWIWEGEQQKKDVLSWACEVTARGGADYVVDKQVGKQAGGQAFPNLHLARLDVTEIVVRGEILTRDPNIQAPPAHFSESATLKRARRREVKYDPVLKDPEEGTYVLRYEEVWLAIGPYSLPQHDGNHHIANIKQAPGDGSMS